jgi:signal transduction histidine kinase/CheY-like chemotaxis protein
MEPALASQPDSKDPEERAERLARELADAIEQQAATSQVLETIGRSALEVEPVFETVVRHAVRLCAADGGLVFQREDDVYRVAFALGGSEEYHRYLEANPIARRPGTLVGHVDMERRTVQIADAIADPRYQWQRARELGGFRTILGVPMLVDQNVVGVIVLWRAQVNPFDERTIGVLTTFAAQAVFAIQNVRRGAALARSVEELGALGEISRAVSSSLDLDEVLTTIVTRAVELSAADGGSIFEFDQDEFILRTCFGTSDELEQALRGIRIRVGETFVGRTATAGEVRQSADLDLEPSDPHVDALRRHGWRSMAAVPLRREAEIIGALIVRRKSRGALPESTVGLLETLASQSAVAIHNARVFRELEDKTRQLEIASRHKSEFLASMSHELRTPLNAVIGFSDVLLDRMCGDLNERQDEYVRDIRDSGRHLLELINEILDLSKVEAGRMELELGAVSLPDVLAYGVTLVRERAGSHGISLELHVAPEVDTVRADELKLKQVVLNLLSNAVKFTPDGGAVSVTAEVVGDEAHVTVRDTGIGIAEADRERIFEAFQRGGARARATPEGTGLGLTLSKRIVDLHGGRLWMQSELGAGSTFAFAIPVLRLSGPVAEERMPPRSRQTGVVLVVEDDRSSADLLRLYLEDAGYDVVVVRDGNEGLEQARRIEPGVVILDILLPGLSGWDLLARLKGDAATSAIPVVIASMLDERGAGFSLGAAEYLVKPVDRDELIDALARCVASPCERRTVVAIDDNSRDLDLVEAALTPEGWTVVRAEGGAEGVRLARSVRPAVVLLDLLMPEVDGFEVVERLRSDPIVADVPIVVLTARDITAADHERLAGRISFLARKGEFGRAELVELVGALAPARGVP